jgi:hypothetical protein
MKKYIYAIMLAVMSITAAEAQRMVPGQKGMEVNAGVLSAEQPSENYYLNIALTVNGKHGSYWLWAMEYTHEYADYKELRIPLETYTAEGGYSLQLLGDARKHITLNAALTAIAGYETINRGRDMLYDGSKILNEEHFLYGAGGRLSLETYLSDHFVFLIQGRAKALWGTSREQLRPSAGIGLRFNF